MRTTGAALVLAVWAHGASAAEPWGNPYDVLLDVPGAIVNESVGDNGEARRTFVLPGGVEIKQFNRNAPETVATDRSGAGAVLCLWDVLATLQPLVQACEAAFGAAASTEVSGQLLRIEVFVERNSYGIISSDQLTTRKEDHRRRMQRRALPQNCASGPQADFVRRLLGDAPGALTAKVDDLLAVERFPARNPCL